MADEQRENNKLAELKPSIQPKHTRGDLQQMQSLPLSAKVAMTKRRIKEWYDYWDGQVYVSFSGGKDSTVLLHLAREVYPDIEAVFLNTGLEYPEIQKFVKTFDNVTTLHPEMRFDEVIKKYGYPIISKEVSDSVYQGRLALKNNCEKHTYRLQKLMGTAKDKNGNKSMFNCEKYNPLLYTDFLCGSHCCNVMKKNPAKRYEHKTGKKPITGQMAYESRPREQKWMINGCNAFETARPMSNPMSFWAEQDVLQYIRDFEIPIASVYGDVVFAEEPDQVRIKFDDGLSCGKLCTTGCKRTGCIFCAFGAHREKPGEGRFERLKETHLKQYAYCIGGGEYNEDGIWQPSKEGLGMGHVFDELNKIYGEGFIRY